MHSSGGSINLFSEGENHGTTFVFSMQMQLPAAFKRKKKSKRRHERQQLSIIEEGAEESSG